MTWNMISWLLVLIIVIIGTTLLQIILNNVRGLIGEKKVKKELNKLPKDKYKVINDLMIKVGDTTTQIDHIVLSSHGIFVIETKNYSGTIYGNEYSSMWTVKQGRDSYNFYSPIRQNYGHIKNLSEKFNIDINKFISVICFTGEAVLNLKDVKTEVVHLDFLKTTIMSRDKELLTNDEINKIYNEFNNANISDKKAREEHVEQINTSLEETDEMIQNGVCPKCGGKLVTRKSKYGTFLGCSNYPKCHFTKNVSK